MNEIKSAIDALIKGEKLADNYLVEFSLKEL